MIPSVGILGLLDPSTLEFFPALTFGHSTQRFELGGTTRKRLGCQFLSFVQGDTGTTTGLALPSSILGGHRDVDDRC